MSESDILKDEVADDQQQSTEVYDEFTEKCSKTIELLTNNNEELLEKCHNIINQLDSHMQVIIKSSEELNVSEVNNITVSDMNKSDINGKQDDCMEIDECVNNLSQCNNGVKEMMYRIKEEVSKLKEIDGIQKGVNNVLINEKESQKKMKETQKEEENVQIQEQEIKENFVNDKINIKDFQTVDNTNPESQEYQKLYYEWTQPKLIYKASKEFKPTKTYENFTKGCHWSPDGTCILVPSEDFKIRIFELPRDLYSGILPKDFYLSDFESTLKVKEGGTVYDTCWFPYMSSWDPSTCCFLSASQGSPVHLWDAFTAQLRATYRAYNLVDEVEAAISVQFTNLGGQIWCGFKNALRIFDTDRPGRQIQNIFLKNQFPNVTGLVSCIRENPLMPGLIAFGTYSKRIGLYKDEPICSFQTSSGVTQIEFSPCGTKLYSAVRRDGEFLCWDLRNPGEVLYSFGNRQSNTNQRIWFDLSYNGEEVVSGGTDGLIRIWNISKSLQENEDINSTINIKVSKDCVNGVSLHKNLPIVAATTGERKCNDEGNISRDNSFHLYWLSG